MILMSASHDVALIAPVAATAYPRREPPPRGSVDAPRCRVDWDRVERLYTFCRARACDGIQAAELRHDSRSASNERHCLRTLEGIYAEAQHHGDFMATCAVSYFRVRAMRDAQHPDFLGEWISLR